MMTKQHRRAIGVFPSREAAGRAIDQLIFSGFPIEKIFLVGQDLAEARVLDADRLYALVEQAHAGALPSTALGLKKGLAVGNAIGGLTGIFLGLGALALPAIGPVMMVPAIALTLLSSGICTAAGGVIGALIGFGLTEKQARAYTERIALGDSLVIVDGTLDEIHRAIDILDEQGIQVTRLGI